MPQKNADAENPAAFKHAYREETIREMAARLAALEPRFGRDAFLAGVLPTLLTLPMKTRVDLIAGALRDALPMRFPEAAAVLVSALGPPGADAGKDAWGPDDPDGTGLSGYQVWPLTRFVARFGLDHHEASLEALSHMTKRWTAEFALRPFLVAEPERTLAVLRTWRESPSQHLRRAVSESTRPRLPWGMQLRAFIADPSPVIELIEPLRHDPEEYVRRSVANNLNDIGKDHPELLVQVAGRWAAEGGAAMGRLVRHALRSRVKAGDPGALGVLGFSVPPRVEVEELSLERTVLRLGETQRLRCSLRSTGSRRQELAVDVVLHLVGARGQAREKVFKGRTVTLPAGATEPFEWSLALRPISTRAYYSGEHALELLICGQRMGRHRFELQA